MSVLYSDRVSSAKGYCSSSTKVLMYKGVRPGPCQGKGGYFPLSEGGRFSPASDHYLATLPMPKLSGGIPRIPPAPPPAAPAPAPATLCLLCPPLRGCCPLGCRCLLLGCCCLCLHPFRCLLLRKQRLIVWASYPAREAPLQLGAGAASCLLGLLWLAPGRAPACAGWAEQAGCCCGIRLAPGGCCLSRLAPHRCCQSSYAAPRGKLQRGGRRRSLACCAGGRARRCIRCCACERCCCCRLLPQGAQHGLRVEGPQAALLEPVGQQLRVCCERGVERLRDEPQPAPRLPAWPPLWLAALWAAPPPPAAARSCRGRWCGRAGL